jgi:hypothetical protein
MPVQCSAAYIESYNLRKEMDIDLSFMQIVESQPGRALGQPTIMATGSDALKRRNK